jgi:hypothetical protein
MNRFLAPALLACRLWAQVLTVAEARADLDSDGIPDLLGQTVTISAVATCEGTLFSSTGLSFFVQDGTGGINVYAYSSASPGDIAAGDQYLITGEIKFYNGLTEISPSDPSDFQYMGSPGVPQPRYLSRHRNINESLEGTLVVFGNTSQNHWVTVVDTPAMSGEGWNFSAWNGDALIAVRVNSTTGIDLTGIVPGTRLVMTGIAGQYSSVPPYDGGYQLLPRYQQDLEIYSPSIPSTFHLDVLGNPFAPALGEVMTVEYGGPPGVLMDLTVFDRSGRAVARLAEGMPAGDLMIWDGRDDMNEILPMGQYVMLLEGTTPSGDRLTTTETVVIATPLN